MLSKDVLKVDVEKVESESEADDKEALLASSERTREVSSVLILALSGEKTPFNESAVVTLVVVLMDPITFP